MVCLNGCCASVGMTHHNDLFLILTVFNCIVHLCCSWLYLYLSKSFYFMVISQSCVTFLIVLNSEYSEILWFEWYCSHQNLTVHKRGGSSSMTENNGLTGMFFLSFCKYEFNLFDCGHKENKKYLIDFAFMFLILGHSFDFYRMIPFDNFFGEILIFLYWIELKKISIVLEDFFSHANWSGHFGEPIYFVGKEMRYTSEYWRHQINELYFKVFT